MSSEGQKRKAQRGEDNLLCLLRQWDGKMQRDGEPSGLWQRCLTLTSDLRVWFPTLAPS